MHVLNAAKSSEYFDSLVDEVEDSAVNVLHGAWVYHTAPLGRLEHLEPATPLDMLILYQAAAATFKNWAAGSTNHEPLANGGRVVNRELAQQKLHSVRDEELAALATRFANQVIALSEHAAVEQDLNYFLELFLHSVTDKDAIDDIVSGEISRHAKMLMDNPDLW